MWHNNRSQFHHFKYLQDESAAFYNNNNADMGLFQIFLLDLNKSYIVAQLHGKPKTYISLYVLRIVVFLRVSIYLALQNVSIQIIISIR